MLRRFEGVLSIVCVLLLMLSGLSAAQKKVNIKGAKSNNGDGRMSAMGELAAKVNAALEAKGFVPPGVTGNNDFDKLGCDNPADCGDDDVPVAGGQAETSIAVDSTGQHIVIGYNDTQGFNENPASLSGFMYSDDGGHTFVVGGRLPTPGNDTIGTTKLPQIFGDPDVKYLGACNFVYSSIMVKKFSATRTVQTMSVHRSTDCGHTWSGPFEVTSATNPHGALSGSGSPRDAADKEFLDVDAATGRVILSWSNFTPFAPGGVEIRTTYSDDILTGNPPTWSTGTIVSAIAEDGQSSIPRFAGNGTNAYVAWRRFPDFYFQTIAFARSTDNGATWQTPIVLGDGPFFASDYQIGNDRPNNSPSMAVDQNSGAVYVVYANNDSQDGSDIYFTRSTDTGQHFSPPIIVNSRPGDDRSQWYPWVTVDKSTGRVWVFYYDQGVATSGDLTQLSYTYSDDGGNSWKQSRQLSERTFHAGWGNDTGQPNLGDYIQGVAQGGELFASFAFTFRPVGGFSDGQPTSSFNVPDTTFVRLPEADHKLKATTLDLLDVAISDSGGNGFIDPDEAIGLTATFRNYVTNPLNAVKVVGATATLTTTTENVSVVQGFSPIHNLDPGQSAPNDTPFVIRTAPGFVPGTPIELVFSVRSAEHGDVVLKHTQLTGTPVSTVLLSENFNGAAPGSLPAGWAAAHGAGQNTVPWTTRNNFCGSTSNAAFHINANDGPTGGSPARFERLIAPSFVVPANATWVSVDFDICTDTEDDPNYNILAYDGFFLRVTDLTTGHFLRSNLLESFADVFTTGDIQSMPRHMPRSSNANYFPNGDMAMWAGFSNGPQHVHLRLPGMAGTTAQLRFEFAQDGGGICTDVRPTHTDCGVSVDNIVVRSVVAPSTQP